MTKNEQWLNMLSILNIAPDASIESGILVSRKLINDSNTWRITLEFENLLPLEKIKFLTTEIKNYLVDNIGFEDVKFSIQYRTLTNNDNLLYEYFDDAIEVLKEGRDKVRDEDGLKKINELIRIYQNKEDKMITLDNDDIKDDEVISLMDSQVKGDQFFKDEGELGEEEKQKNTFENEFN